MKKLKFNSTLNHKVNSYKTYEISVEKVITLYGNSFNRLKNDALDDNPYIAKNRDLMYIDSDDVAHCLLFVDYDSGDGLLVESEGADYTRKSQFISNARAIIEQSDLTTGERQLHAELAHTGQRTLSFEDMLSDGNMETMMILKSVTLCY